MSKEQLLNICTKSLELKGLSDEPKYKKRLKWELDEIFARQKWDYFLNLFENKIRYSKNQNNLLVCWLLGIVKDFDIEQAPACEYGEYPDIDVDYLKEVREYLKGTWAPKYFGEEYVCNIGSYTTFGIKNTLLDMARVHDKSRDEVLALTKNIENKDEDGDPITWETALKQYPELAKYCEENKDVAQAVRKLLHRNRGMGVHAAGLIIANSPLHQLVPLYKRKDSLQASAWTEGLHGQDLGPVGLVKFDLLVIANLKQIAICCELIKKRHGIEGICNLPGQPDWSDVPKWRNDPKALEMASRGDLKCIFQFDSEGIRNLVKNGGVDSFEDLVAYTALYRPGPLGMKMQERYVERKKGRESYSLHPLIKPILEKSYGVLVYQEDIMKILHVVGEIPLKDCEYVRKAISKKKIETFIKYKEVFVRNGMKNLQVSEEEMNNLWDQIQSFAEYGFNKSMTKETLIPYKGGFKEIQNFVPGDIVYCIDQNGNRVETKVVNLHDHGEIEGYEITFDDGYKVICSANHKFLTEKGQVSLKEICRSRLYILGDQKDKGVYDKKKNRRMGKPMRKQVYKSQGDERAQGKLQKLQTKNFGIETKKFQTCFSMRTEVSNEDGQICSSTVLHPVQTISMEKNFKESYVSLRHGISNLARKRGTSKDMQEMSGNKIFEYSMSNGKIEHRQFTSRQKKEDFRYCTKNFVQTRNSSRESRGFEEVEATKSREVCREHTKGSRFPQIFSYGGMVEEPIKLDFRKDSLWTEKKKRRFCQRQYMDRSRWLLSFLRTSEQYRQATSPSTCSIARSDAKRGMYQKKKCHVAAAEHGVFSFFDGRNEDEHLGLGAIHAPITNTRNLVPRKIIRVRPVGKRHMFDLEVANVTHNFILPNGVVTSNSHAVSYTYISAYLLYLKAHYPEEFFASVLSCENKTENIKSYKMEARVHKIEVCPVDINLSDVNFVLRDNKIYFGLSSIKGITEIPAQRIVDNQPYANFEDFLNKFGTDADVIKAIVGLRCFKDADPITLYKFYEVYKEALKKKESRQQKYVEAMEGYEAEFKKLVPDETRRLSDLQGENPFEDSVWKKFDVDESSEILREVKCKEGDQGAYGKFITIKIDLEDTNVSIEKEVLQYYRKAKVPRTWNRWKELKKLWLKRQKRIENQKNYDAEILPKLANFDPRGHEIDKKIAKDFSTIVAGEEKFYGFPWIHELEKSPDYTGNKTFESLKNDSNNNCGPVELKVLKIESKQSKKNKNFTYYQITAEDVTSQEGKINIWPEDWERWSQEFAKDNLLRVRLQPPSGGFPTFTLEPNQIGKYRNQKKWIDKQDDYRVVIMQKPPVDELKDDEFLNEEEVLNLFSNCTME